MKKKESILPTTEAGWAEWKKQDEEIQRNLVIPTSYCGSCGAIDSVRQTSDNAICTECGDTEHHTWSDDFTDEEWEALTNGE